MGQGRRRTACWDTGTEGLDLKNGHLRCPWCSPGLADLNARGYGIGSAAMKPGWAGNMQSPGWIPGKTLPSLTLGCSTCRALCLRAHSVTAQVLSQEVAQLGLAPAPIPALLPVCCVA